MPTAKQELGELGERVVAMRCACMRCKRPKSLRRLPANFKCADVVCDFCGYMAQVKARQTARIEILPDQILGGAWSVQKERMDAGIYFPLFVVQVTPDRKESRVFYLSADLQTPAMFKPRKPLGPQARRAGWQGFIYDLTAVHSRFVLISGVSGKPNASPYVANASGAPAGVCTTLEKRPERRSLSTGKPARVDVSQPMFGPSKATAL